MQVAVSVPVSMVGLCLASAFFSAAETALFSLDPAEAKRHSAGDGLDAHALAWCRAHARSVLLTILLGNLALNTLYFALAGYWAGREGGVAATAIGAAALLSLVAFAEILPKSLALANAGRFATLSAPVLRLLTFAAAPMRIPLMRFLQLLARRVTSAEPTEPSLSHAEVQALVEKQPERFGLGRRAASVVAELVQLGELQVRDVMRPQVDLPSVRVDASVESALALALSAGESWLAIDGDEDVAAFVDAKDLLVAEPDAPVASVAKPFRLIPETARLHHLLELFGGERGRRVLVVDEYGAAVGVVGWDDLCDGMTGGLLRAEHEDDEVPVRLRSGRGWEVVGSLGLREFGELFSRRLPMQRNRTIGGWIVEQLGHLPEVGERVHVEGLRLEVVGASRERVHKVLVSFVGARGAGNGAAEGDDET